MPYIQPVLEEACHTTDYAARLPWYQRQFSSCKSVDIALFGLDIRQPLTPIL